MALHSVKTPVADGNYRVDLDNDLITVTIHGKVTGALIRAIVEEVAHMVASVKTQGKRALVLVDVTTIRFRDIRTEARTEGRRALGSTPADAWAIVGTSHLGALTMYLARAAGISSKMRYFTNLSLGRRWLRGKTDSKPARSSVSAMAGTLIALIGLSALVGWQIGNPYLTSLITSLRPMNPLAAVGLLALGAGFICYWLNAFRVLRIAGAFGIILGILALLPINIDTVLYSHAIQAAGAHVQLADSAAVCFILIGVIGFLAGRKERWADNISYTITGIVILVTAFNIYGQLYAHDFIYGLSGNFVMALNLAFAFLVAAVALSVILLSERSASSLQQVTRTGWLIVIALIAVQFATYGAWSQTLERSEKDSLQAFTTKANDINDQITVKLRAYISALRGFRGLYAASSSVSQGDFEAYYKSLDLKKDYPGLRTIAFVAAVKTQDLPAFIAQRKADKSLMPGGNPTFAIGNQTSDPLHYIITYIAETPTSSSYGLDITSVAGRSTIYNNALRANDYYSSGTITFPTTSVQASADGFFLAAPVSTADSTQKIGVVTANFNYSDFFSALFKTNNIDGLTISAADSTNDAPIYTSGNRPTGDGALSKEFVISLAQNEYWKLKIEAPTSFASTKVQGQLARTILVGGQLFTLLMLSIFILQVRARGRALELVDVVTEDLQHERNSIAELHKKDEAILAGIGEGLIAIDQHGKIEIVNAAARRLSGYSEQEMIGKPLSAVMKAVGEKGLLIEERRRPFHLALRQAKVITARLSYVHKNGQLFPVELNVAPIILNGKTLGAIEVFRDITRERQLEHMKDEFLSVASHELRTPMGAVRANLSMILGGDYGPVNKGLVEPLTDMKSSTVRLVELVNDLLNVARIEAGRMQFTLSDFTINEALRSVVSSLAPLGQEKGVKISLTPGNNDIKVQADVDKVKQVLTNLIGNSLKFTDKGNITISASTHNDMIEVAVSDTGVGITPDDQKLLFGKFKQITSAQAGKPAGTGLGLYISREIVRKMGGELWIKSSAPGKGSVFAFTIPRANSPKAKKSNHAIEQEAKLHPDQL